MGAPKNNLNAVKSGRYSEQLKELSHQLRRQGLVVGEPPKPLQRTVKSVLKYRRYLLGLVSEIHGEISPQDRHLVDEGASYQAHALTCIWLLREKLNDMTHADIRATSRDIAQAKTGRNKAVAQLGLNRQMDPWAILEAESIPTGDDQQNRGDEGEVGPAGDNGTAEGG
jgi:hypothetical protein